MAQIPIVSKQALEQQEQAQRVQIVGLAMSLAQARLTGGVGLGITVSDVVDESLAAACRLMDFVQSGEIPGQTKSSLVS